jgi:hypothetical protein
MPRVTRIKPPGAANLEMVSAEGLRTVGGLRQGLPDYVHVMVELGQVVGLVLPQHGGGHGAPDVVFLLRGDVFEGLAYGFDGIGLALRNGPSGHTQGGAHIHYRLHALTGGQHAYDNTEEE